MKKHAQTCITCLKVKPLADFFERFGEHHHRCKACSAEIVAGRKLIEPDDERKQIYDFQSSRKVSGTDPL